MPATSKGTLAEVNSSLRLVASLAQWLNVRVDVVATLRQRQHMVDIHKARSIEAPAPTTLSATSTPHSPPHPRRSIVAARDNRTPHSMASHAAPATVSRMMGLAPAGMGGVFTTVNALRTHKHPQPIGQPTHRE
jgi:hypothetical protein